MSARSHMTYRGVTLERAWGGHINAGTDDGFIGAFPSFTAARERIDRMLAPAPRCVRVGENTYAGGDMPTVEYRPMDKRTVQS